MLLLGVLADVLQNVVKYCGILLYSFDVVEAEEDSDSDWTLGNPTSGPSSEESYLRLHTKH